MIGIPNRLVACAILAALGGWLVLGRPAVAQDRAVSASPDADDGPQLRVSTPKRTYQQGELIPLDLSFTSKAPNSYRLNLASYDRSGRMSFETFLVEPTDGTADPLAAYFKSSTLLIGGGLSSMPRALSDSPAIIHLYLNEWVRFDKPGKYSLTIESRRVGEGSGAMMPASKSIRSNTIDLQITAPDAAWEQAELQKTLAELDSSPPPTGPFSSSPRLTAMLPLRYLGSADAAKEMARHMRGDENQVDWNCMFGLVGSPNRLAGLTEMKQLLIDPDFPVGSMFLTAMSVVPLDPTESPEALRPERDANLKDARSMLMGAISTKRGKAMAVSVATVLSDADPEDRSRFVSLLIENFIELSIEQQRKWLENQWPTVKDPKWLSTLRAIANQYTDFPRLNVLPAYDSLKLTSAALTDWYDLDPEGARPAVIAEIVRPRPRYSANTLGILPDAALPEAERAIADHFLATDDDIFEGNLASLLNRYADGAVLPDVLDKIRRKVASGHWACNPENDSVAFVQRVDPDVGNSLLEEVTSACRKITLRSDRP
jgi:hypothetical protein